jgi:hypothetical protein
MVRAILLLGFVAVGSTVWVGCGEGPANNGQPVMVVPDVPPAQAQKDSMDFYLKSHPDAAKKAGKGMAP